MKALLGPPPIRKQHNWESDWLNQPNGEKLCKTCGCTWWNPSLDGKTHYAGLVSSSEPGKFKYTDINNNGISSKVELFCPVYLDGLPTEIMAQKESLRAIKREGQIAEARLEQLEERLGSLGEENLLLRAQLAQGPQVNLQELAQAMLEILRKRELSDPRLALSEAQEPDPS